MELPARFRDLPTWAAVLGSLLGAFVVLTAISMVLGVVFAGIAVGVELGSATLGVVAALVGLTIVVAPILAAITLFSRGDDAADGGGGHDDPVEALRHEYASGEIGEETFERRLDTLLTEADRKSVPGDGANGTAIDRGSPLEEPE